jgi:hypothetical protein
MDLSERDLERMADAILRGDAVRLGATARDVQDAAEIAIARVRQQLRGAVDPFGAAILDKLADMPLHATAKDFDRLVGQARVWRDDYGTATPRGGA